MVVKKIQFLRPVSREHFVQHGARPGIYGFRLRREITSRHPVQDFVAGFKRSKSGLRAELSSSTQTLPGIGSVLRSDSNCFITLIPPSTKGERSRKRAGA